MKGGEYMEMAYKWSTNLYSKVKPEDAGREFEQIEAENGYITPQAVVDRARPENSVMHKLFEWNDSVAAEKYRNQQAGFIIGALIVTKSDTNYNKRAFVNIVASPHSPQSKPQYIRVDRAFSDPTSKAIILKNAVADLKRFKEKYAALKELSEVFKAIEKL
jgi:hypothetical protein